MKLPNLKHLPRPARRPVARLARVAFNADGIPPVQEGDVPVPSAVMRVRPGQRYSELELMTPYGRLSALVETPELQRTGVEPGDDSFAVFNGHDLTLAFSSAASAAAPTSRPHTGSPRHELHWLI